MLNITPQAIERVKELVPPENRSTQGLRLWVEHGGCSGMQYQMKVESKRASDEVIPCGDVSVFVDRASSVYLMDCTLDFESALSNIGFKIINPRAKSTCGCGTSFQA